MYLWLDDVRPAPDGWTLARTAQEAIDLIDQNGSKIEAVSLDHDLGASPDDGLFARGTSLETGLDVARHIAKTLPFALDTPIRLHTWSPVGAQNMQWALEAAGYRPVIAAYRVGES